MNAELHDAFAAQLREVHIQIATARAELDEIELTEDRELAACQREKIAGLSKLIETLRHSQDTILASETEAHIAAEKFAEWRAVVIQVRSKAKEFDGSAAKVPRAAEELNTTRALVQNAMGELQLHHANKPGPLALAKEVAAFDAETVRLQNILDSLSADMRRCGNKEVEFRRVAFQLRDELSVLSSRENRLRPPSLSQHSDGSGLFRVVM